MPSLEQPRLQQAGGGDDGPTYDVTKLNPSIASSAGEMILQLRRSGPLLRRPAGRQAPPGEAAEGDADDGAGGRQPDHAATASASPTSSSP
ncbi:hypothetical protein ACRAWF_44405 [Streptomyces sp. L7]